MSAREFWQLVAQTDPGSLVTLDVAGIAALLDVSVDEAMRLRTLLDAATALSFEQERLHDCGISLVSALDDRFPARLRDRLGAACPPFLLVAGPIDWLGRPGLGIVGSRDAHEGASAVARDAARARRRNTSGQSSAGWPVAWTRRRWRRRSRPGESSSACPPRGS